MRQLTPEAAGALTPERLHQIRALFEALIDLAPEPRQARLRQQRARDASLVHEVEQLIAAYERETGFMNGPLAGLPALGTTPDAAAAADPNLAGSRIGSYEIVREIGRGGMGTVYEGVRIDGSFRMRVAIKIIRATVLTESVRERFHLERQILAGLDHPGIARILDGGTTPSGRPYLVMEHVDGVRIDQYCETRLASLDQRLDLFVRVCEAVQYAHDHLIVHRDLKPGNILVTADGEVKLLDFGIAKMLAAPAEATPATSPQPSGAASGLLLTPEYASPEQMLGKPITAATDVYLLGLLFYELLAGVHPFRKDGQPPHETMRAICEVDPAKPSVVAIHAKARRRLKGELDTIAMMALQKDPRRRYTSVEHFRNDIARHRTGLPVLAHGDRLGYRAAKFLRRNLLGVAAVLLIIASLAAGIIVSTAEARRARNEQRALRSLVTTLLFDLHDDIHHLAGAAPARRLVLGKAQEYLEALSKETGNDLQLQRELAIAYERTGDLLHDAIGMSPTDNRALASYQKALDLRQAIAREAGSSAGAQRDVAFSLGKVGDGHFFHGETKEALDDYANAKRLAGTVLTMTPADAESHKVMGYIENRRCIVLASAGDARNASDACRAAITHLDQARTASPKDALVRQILAATYAAFGNLQCHTHQATDGLANLARAETLFAALAAEEPNNVEYRRRISYTQIYVAQALVQQNDRVAGMAAYNKAVASMETLLSIDPSDAKSPMNLAFMLTRMASQMKKDGNVADAERAGAKAIELLRVVAEQPGAGPYELNEYANALVKSEFAAQRQPAKALDLARRASEATRASNPTFLDTLAWAEFLTGDRAAAIATERKALSLVAAGNAIGQGLRQELEQNLAHFEAAARPSDTGHRRKSRA
jgi:tetratricopeptide (TPR) repeat protein